MKRMCLPRNPISLSYQHHVPIRRYSTQTNEGPVLFRQGKISQTIRYFEKLLQEHPTEKSPDDLLLCYRIKRRYDDAIKLLSQQKYNSTQLKKISFIKEDFDVGLFYLLKGDTKNALPYFDASIKDECDYRQHLGRAIIAYQEGRLDAASKSFREAARWVPDLLPGANVICDQLLKLMQECKNNKLESKNSILQIAEDILIHIHSGGCPLPTLVTDKPVPFSLPSLFPPNDQPQQTNSDLATFRCRVGDFVEDQAIVFKDDSYLMVTNPTLIMSLQHVPPKPGSRVFEEQIGVSIRELNQVVTRQTEFRRKNQPKLISVDELTELLKKSHKTVVVTGPRVSAESGLGKQTWEYNDSLPCWNPSYAAVLWNRVRQCLKPTNFNPQPNDIHLCLANMEQKGLVKGFITQNMDGLHQKAGSKNVVELHGSLSHTVCETCDVIVNTPCAEILQNGTTSASCTQFNKECCLLKNDPTKKPGNLKPNVLQCNEVVPNSLIKDALEMIAESDLLLYVGVEPFSPANDLTQFAQLRNIKTAQVVGDGDNVLDGVDWIVKTGGSLSSLMNGIKA